MRKGHRAERVLGRLPKVHVRTRQEMARLLSQYRWLLEAQAHQKLGETPEATECVNATVAEMLAEERPDMPHALQNVTQALRAHCAGVLRKRARKPTEAETAWAADKRYDPVLGAWTEELAARVKELPKSQRTAIELVSKGVGVRDIATALGVKPKTVTMNLYRARQRLAPDGSKQRALVVPALLGLRGVWHRLWGPSVHLRDAGTRWLASANLGASVGPQVAAATVLVSVTAWVLSSAAPPPVQYFGAGQPPDQAVQAASAVLPGTSPTATTTPRGDAFDPSAVRLPMGVPPLHLVHRTSGGPESTQLLAAEPAPRYEQNHTIVALGQAPACACILLFRSTDGGHQWDSAPGPPMGTELALPPDYPNDPRIFIGSPAQATGGSDYVADAFGGSYTPLPGSGLIALSGTFDETDDQTAYLASSAGVLAVRMTGMVPEAPVLTAGIWGPVMLVSRPDGPGVLVVAPPGSLAPTAAPGAAPGALGDSALLRCVSASCLRLADLGAVGVRSLAVSTTYATDHTLGVYTDSQILVSTTAGSSFASVPLPPGVGTVGSVAIADGRVWVVTGAGSVVRVGWLAAENGTWHDVALPVAQPGSRGVLVAAGADRLLYLQHDQGFRCSSDAGRTWSTSCPSRS